MQYYFDGDSNLYEYETKDKPFSMPTKTKQMGSIENGVKIYMEDYVYTYLYQYGRSGGGREKLAVLVGRHYVVDGQDTLVVSGAIQGKATVSRISPSEIKSAAYSGCPNQTVFLSMIVIGLAI